MGSGCWGLLTAGSLSARSSEDTEWWLGALPGGVRQEKLKEQNHISTWVLTKLQGTALAGSEAWAGLETDQILGFPAPARAIQTTWSPASSPTKPRGSRGLCRPWSSLAVRLSKGQSAQACAACYSLCADVCTQLPPLPPPR